MPDNKKNNDIEELNLDDLDLELEIEGLKLESDGGIIENLSLDGEGTNVSSEKEDGLSPSKVDSTSSSEEVDSPKEGEEKKEVPESTGVTETGTEGATDNDLSEGSENMSPAALENGGEEEAPGEEANPEAGGENSSGKKEDETSQTNDDKEKKDKGDKDDKDSPGLNPEESKDKKDGETGDKEKEKKDQSDKPNDPKDQNGNKGDKDQGQKPNDKKDDDKNNLGNKGNDENKTKPNPDNSSNTKPEPNKPGQNKNRLKDKWDNRPKTPKDFANRAKQGAKNRAQDAFNNSKVGKTVNGAKNLADKGKKAIAGTKKAVSAAVKFFSTPAGWITLGIIAGLLLILVIVICVPSMFAAGSPGVGGEVENEENYNKYSEIDQKTIDNLKKKTARYATGDPTYAMAATLYPYMEEMQNGNVSSLRGKNNNKQEDDEDIYDESDIDDQESQEDETSGNDETDAGDNDPYLVLLRERKYLNKFTKLLKESRGGEAALTEFLKSKWFKKDAGYKELFDGVTNEEELADAIIDDILNQKDDFEGYFFDNRVCSVNMTSIGTVEIDEMLKSNILVDVKVESCKKGNINDCQSKYANPISMEKYVMGVTYEEIGVSASSDIEKVKAQMVAAKSYVIGRSSTMGWDVKQTPDGSYVVQIRSNTNDQDYCDVDTGCQDKINGAKRNAIDAATRALMSEAWEATKDVYIYNVDKKRTAGEFCQSRFGVCSFCNKGTCLAHQELSEYRNTDYDKILGDQYSSYALITIQGDYADASVSSGETCAVNGLGIPDDQFKFYYQFNYANVAFCGASNHVNSCKSGSNSICSSGCGVTSFAMLISNLSDQSDFDPVAANQEAKNNGGCGVGEGSNDSLFTQISKKHDGFRYEQLDTTSEGANNAVAALRDGALIAANVQSNSPFTSGGHWILLRGITEDGMVKVADPNSKERSTTGTYNISDFIDKNWFNGHHWFAIYGPRSEEIKAMNDAASEQGAAGEIINTEGGIKGQFFAPIQNNNLKMYGKNSANGGKYHDLGASCGTAVYSPADGTATFKTITRNGKLASYGNEVEINTTDGYKIILSHLKSFVGYNVKYGTGSTYPSSCNGGGCNTHTYGTRQVQKGEKLGLSGTSGNSTGCHLHIEIWKGSTRLEPSGLLGYGVR